MDNFTNYQGQFTGTQIDNAIRKVEGGPSALGAAPGGKGYGDAMAAIEVNSASETYAEFCSKVDAVLATMNYRTAVQVMAYPPELYGFGAQVATLARSNAKYATLTSVIGYDPDVFGWRMVLKNGVWQPLEWLNPPMKLGVEYRTTERYRGYPVYKQLFYLGVATTGDWTANLSVTGGFLPLSHEASITAEAGGRIPFPYTVGSGFAAEIKGIVDKVVTVYTSEGFKGRKVYLEVRYLKDITPW